MYVILIFHEDGDGYQQETFVGLALSEDSAKRHLIDEFTKNRPLYDGHHIEWKLALTAGEVLSPNELIKEGDLTLFETTDGVYGDHVGVVRHVTPYPD